MTIITFHSLNVSAALGITTFQYRHRVYILKLIRGYLYFLERGLLLKKKLLYQDSHVAKIILQKLQSVYIDPGVWWGSFCTCILFYVVFGVVCPLVGWLGFFSMMVSVCLRLSWSNIPLFFATVFNFMDAIVVLSIVIGYLCQIWLPMRFTCCSLNIYIFVSNAINGLNVIFNSDLFIFFSLRLVLYLPIGLYDPFTLFRLF